MMFKGGTSLSLRVVVKLAELQTRITAAKLAEITDIAYDHLIKIVQKLRAAQIINTTRGKGGGMWLIRDPEELSVGEVIESVDGKIYIRECMYDPKFCRFQQGCKIKDFYTEVNEVLREKLYSKSIADILRG